jgi:putative restriction endonuclease
MLAARLPSIPASLVNCQLDAFCQPSVRKGLPLSKLHHAAFDANLIGIDPDYRVPVSQLLLSMNDGPMFEQGTKAVAGRKIRMPGRAQDRPDRDRLAQRFEKFIAVR